MPHTDQEKLKAYKKRRSLAVKDWRNRSKRRIIKAMGGCCQICSYDRSEWTLELHHIDPTQKELSFNRLRANPKSAKSIIPELKKCVLLCANCHREIHHGVTELPENYQTLDEELYLSLLKTLDV